MCTLLFLPLMLLGRPLPCAHRVRLTWCARVDDVVGRHHCPAPDKAQPLQRLQVWQVAVLAVVQKDKVKTLRLLLLLLFGALLRLLLHCCQQDWQARDDLATQPVDDLHQLTVACVLDHLARHCCVLCIGLYAQQQAARLQVACCAHGRVAQEGADLKAARGLQLLQLRLKQLALLRPNLVLPVRAVVCWCGGTKQHW